MKHSKGRETMKHLKIIALLLIVISQTFMLQSAYRRAGATGARGYFSRTGGAARSLTTETGAISRTPITCPNVGSRSFMSGRFPETPLRVRAYKFGKQAGEQAREFAGKHRGKLWVAGTAGAGYGAGKAIQKHQENAARAQIYLGSFEDLINSYNKERDEAEMIELIKDLQEVGGINTGNEPWGHTLLRMVIEANRLTEADREAILTLAIEHGARPKEVELKKALGLTEYESIPYERSGLYKLNPKNNVLKIILPLYDQKTSLKIIDLAKARISNIKHDVRYQSEESKKRALSTIETFRELKNIAEENLNKRRLRSLATTGKEEAELK